MSMWKSTRGAGGTPGGTGDFVLGVVLALIGLYLLSRQVRVTTGFWGRWFGWGEFGVSAFGVTMIILMIGVVLIFQDGRSRLGWVITGGSLLFTLIGIIANLQVVFAPTSLYVTLAILGLLAVGLGLILRGVRPH